MARYSIRIKSSVRKDLRHIPNKDVQRILQRIESLADDPRPTRAEMLAGDGKYRIRQGNYRILYTVEDDVLTIQVVKVGHRKDVYRSI
jgi:mRNA interferase RelE/StbE